MQSVISKDGTTIAYDMTGRGPAVILVAGAFSYRKYPGSVQLADLLAKHFTVFNYDRRGRGDSGDTKPYAVEREIEDIQALIDAAGGEAFPLGPFLPSRLRQVAWLSTNWRCRNRPCSSMPLIVNRRRISPHTSPI